MVLQAKQFMSTVATILWAKIQTVRRISPFFSTIIFNRHIKNRREITLGGSFINTFSYIGRVPIGVLLYGTYRTRLLLLL